MYVGEVPIPAGADASDCALAAGGLLRLLHDKLPAAPAHAARALLVLLDHLDHHYKRPAIFMHHPEIRIKVTVHPFHRVATVLEIVDLTLRFRH